MERGTLIKATELNEKIEKLKSFVSNYHRDDYKIKLIVDNEDEDFPHSITFDIGKYPELIKLLGSELQKVVNDLEFEFKNL